MKKMATLTRTLRSLNIGVELHWDLLAGVYQTMETDGSAFVSEFEQYSENKYDVVVRDASYITIWTHFIEDLGKERPNYIGSIIKFTKEN